MLQSSHRLWPPSTQLPPEPFTGPFPLYSSATLRRHFPAVAYLEHLHPSCAAVAIAATLSLARGRALLLTRGEKIHQHWLSNINKLRTNGWFETCNNHKLQWHVKSPRQSLYLGRISLYTLPQFLYRRAKVKTNAPANRADHTYNQTPEHMRAGQDSRIYDLYCHLPLIISRMQSHAYKRWPYQGTINRNGSGKQTDISARFHSSLANIPATLQLCEQLNFIPHKYQRYLTLRAALSKTWCYAHTIIDIFALSKDSTTYHYQNLHTITTSPTNTNSNKSRKLDTRTYSIPIEGICKAMKYL